MLNLSLSGKGLFEPEVIEELAGPTGTGDQRPNDAAAKW